MATDTACPTRPGHPRVRTHPLGSAAARKTPPSSTCSASWPAYIQALHVILDQAAARAYDPELVGRLLRLREARRRDRSARVVGFKIT